MDDQKIENLLNLAMDATPEEREKSRDLSLGYNPANQTWEVIVRYHGSLREAAMKGWKVVPLSGGYAIVTLPQEDVDVLAALPQVEYVEKPKRLYFQLDAGRAASCISSLQTPENGLFGSGILTAVIDSGIDYFHPDFRNEDGTTRIVAIWDQGALQEELPQEETLQERIPQEETLQKGITQGDASQDTDFQERTVASFLRVAGGREYTQEQINAALQAGTPGAGLAIVPVTDETGHGTQVLGIAAGNGRSSGGRYRGVAPKSPILVVKLGRGRTDAFPRTTELMKALEYVSRKAGELQMPAAINLSFGNVYGSHRGNTLLENYMDQIADQGQNVIAAGMGNEGNVAGHAAGRLKTGESQRIEFQVGEFETTLNIQLWKNYADTFEIVLIGPDGRRIGPLRQESGTSRYQLPNVTLLVYYGEPGPYQIQQEIYLDFIPNGTYLDSGIWSLEFIPVQIVTGEYNLWMNESRSRSGSTQFLRPSPDTTMTIPATASNVIAVGAYDARLRTYAAFSGRGWPGEEYRNRPDLAAPGVDITTTNPGGGYISVSGTSFAAPFVTGAAALLMEWGIVRGNDPYLYGEKVRAYLRKGARQLPGFEVWPNNLLGYGVLCVQDSLPK